MWTREPENDILSAYQPIAFRYGLFSTDDVEKLLVTVFINGNAFIAYRKDIDVKNNNYHEFNIDIQTILQEYLYPNGGQSTSFAAINAFQIYYGLGSSLIGNKYCDVFIDGRYERRNADNFLETVNPASRSDTFRVFNGIIQPTDTIQVADFIYDPSTNPQACFLTNAPLEQDIAIDENYSLSLFTYGMASISVRYYFKDGSSILQQSSLTAPGNEKHISTMGVGPANLIHLFSTSFDEVVKYEVSFGAINDALNFETRSKTITFTLVKRCPGSIRLHWLNQLGSADAFTFEERVAEKQQTKTRLAENITNHLIKSIVESQRSFEIEENIEDPYNEWFKELRASAEVYWEHNNQYLPVSIDDSDQQLTDNKDWKVNFKIKVNLPEDITHVI